jgi:sporulation protein YlmC with PRC-barrel domain
VSGDAVHQPTWPLLLKIEHMVKLQVLGNNSKTVNNIKNLTWGKNDQHIKDTLVMIQTKFGFHWSSTFRGEDFLKSLRRTTTDAK